LVTKAPIGSVEHDLLAMKSIPSPSSRQMAHELVLSGSRKLRWHPRLDSAPPALPRDIDLADKVEGMMLGLAIGDALGNTSESINPADRQSLFGPIEHYLPNRFAGGRAVGLPSDDSQLAFRTLAHLVLHGRLDPPLLGDALADGQIYGIGQATRQWLQAWRNGRPWYQTGTPSAGNGSLMRIAPVIIPHLKQPGPDLWSDALLAGHLTHDDELSNLSCVAFVELLWAAIATLPGEPMPRWLEQSLAMFDELGTGVAYAARNGHPPGFAGTIGQLLRQHVRPALQRNLDVATAGSIWHSGAYLLETVPSVLYILERHGHDPREAILQAVNHTRDNDTVAAIVGAAVGALHGASALPSAWIEDLSGRTAEADDGRMFMLLVSAAERFGYGTTPRLRERVQRRHGWI
jgi:ADP-ribosylglycohydrolase